ncbi:hypothetical protein B0A48_17055 [Cryoendolithus antarcticus]|uniref:Transcription factor domain-containing protein n=1 Tax=Cryoendolithus antarcticus TaxID=1507870 RepID=A0A1V8SBR4_9PEZI|nr:hypothetical protein B0A48_17055 [Cryoendolithus antarcticus]
MRNVHDLPTPAASASSASEIPHDPVLSDGGNGGCALPSVEQRSRPSDTTGVSSQTLGTHGLDVDLANHLLDRFRTMQHHFPFIIIGSTWTVNSMQETHSFLLLAALATAAVDHPHAQQQLAKNLQKAVAHQVVVDGETSLDLLQSLLVYLAWSHYHIVPRSQQGYKLLQIAISLAVDLGLDDEPRKLRGKRVDISHGQRLHDGTVHETSTEAVRASLGCAYLSALMTGSMCKPNTLLISQYMLDQALTLAREPQNETDIMLLPLLQYESLLEPVHKIYALDEAREGITRLHVHAKRFVTELDAWKSRIAETTWLKGNFAGKYHAAKIWIYEMGLLFHFSLARSCPVVDLGVSGSSALLANLDSVYTTHVEANNEDTARAENESNDGANSPHQSPPSRRARKKQPVIPAEHTGATPASTALDTLLSLLECTDLVLILHRLLPQDLIRDADQSARFMWITSKAVTKAVLEAVEARGITPYELVFRLRIVWRPLGGEMFSLIPAQRTTSGTAATPAKTRCRINANFVRGGEDAIHSARFFGSRAMPHYEAPLDVNDDITTMPTLLNMSSRSSGQAKYNDSGTTPKDKSDAVYEGLLRNWLLVHNKRQEEPE